MSVLYAPQYFDYRQEPRYYPTLHKMATEIMEATGRSVGLFTTKGYYDIYADPSPGGWAPQRDGWRDLQNEYLADEGRLAIIAGPKENQPGTVNRRWHGQRVEMYDVRTDPTGDPNIVPIETNNDRDTTPRTRPFLIFDENFADGEDAGFIYSIFQFGESSGQYNWEADLYPEQREFWELWRDSIIAGVEEHGLGTLTDEERAELFAARRAAEYERSMNFLKEWGAKAFKDQIAALRNQRDDAVKAAETALKKYETNLMISTNATRELAKYESMNTEAERVRAMEQYQAIFDHAMCASIKVTDKAFVIETTELEIMPDPDRRDWRFPLGRFRITLPMTPQSNLLMVNLSNAKHNRPHPHVNPGGVPCYGSYQKTIFDLINAGEMCVAFDLVIDYLTSIGDDAWSDFVIWWTDESWDTYKNRLKEMKPPRNTQMDKETLLIGRPGGPPEHDPVEVTDEQTATA